MKTSAQKYTVVLCPRCNKKARIYPGKETLPDGIERTFYRCGKCGHRTTVCYTDAEIRALMEKQKAVFSSGNRALASKNARRLESMMDALQVKMEGGSHTPT